MTAALWPWAALLLLGAVHGLNPGMGWLFAVALGLQERRSRAVWSAMLPLAAGHALAIGSALALAAAVGLALSPATLRWIVAAALVLLGVARMLRHRHPRWGGMRVGPRDLTIWSFLMATAHGAGLMAVPLAVGGTMHHAMPGMAPAGSAGLALGATLMHTAGYLLVTVVLAVLVYERWGLRMLRSAWINLDFVWAVALAATGLLTVAA